MILFNPLLPWKNQLLVVPLTFEDLVVPPNTLVLAWILALRNYEQNLVFVLIGCVIFTRLFPSETLPADSIIVLKKTHVTHNPKLKIIVSTNNSRPSRLTFCLFVFPPTIISELVSIFDNWSIKIPFCSVQQIYSHCVAFFLNNEFSNDQISFSALLEKLAWMLWT